MIYTVVKGFVFILSEVVWFDLQLIPFESVVDQATANMHCCYTSFNTSCLVFVPYDHSHKMHTDTLHCTLAAGGFAWPAVTITELSGQICVRKIREQRKHTDTLLSGYVQYRVTLHCILLVWHSSNIHWHAQWILINPDMIWRKYSSNYC